MNVLKNMKIGLKLSLLVGLIIVFVATSMVITITGLNNIKDYGELTKNESLVYAMYAKDLESEVVQVQQWLTDISATRGAEGYDDGFNEAEKHYQNGQEIIARFEAMFNEENDTKALADIRQLESQFAEFYSVGKEMAQQYIKYGPEQGNQYMEKFDPFAEKLTDSLEPLVQSQVAELNESMLNIINVSKNSISLSVVLFAVVLLFSISFSFVVVKGITNSVNKVVAMIKDIAEGEGDLTKRLSVDSKDELGTLATWFNTFVEKVNGIIVQVKESAEQVASASEQISASSEELASGAEEQQSQTSEVATSIEQMTATILDSSQNANKALESSQKANETATTGGGVVEETVAGMARIADAVRASSDQIAELGKRSEEIGKIIGVIDDIADQTNLLALNANIEAARAGEQGRGFAVVADEVRVLAERTTKATAEIADMIKGIQDGTGSAVEAMNEGMKEVDSGVESAEAAGKSLTEIIAVVQDVQTVINQIAASTEEQSSGAEQISANVEGISTVTKQSANAAQQVASAAQQLSQETDDLNKLVGQFKL